MHGWYSSMGAGDWVVMSLFWVGLIALIAWVVARLAVDREPSGERPEEILDRRLASGEIDAATYDALRVTLREAHTGKA
jgi:putative membrane protein